LNDDIAVRVEGKEGLICETEGSGDWWIIDLLRVGRIGDGIDYKIKLIVGIGVDLVCVGKSIADGDYIIGEGACD
jgi:hypothetical protein